METICVDFGLSGLMDTRILPGSKKKKKEMEKKIKSCAGRHEFKTETYLKKKKKLDFLP